MENKKTITETFSSLITIGVNCLSEITDPKEKGMIAAELAKAVSLSGLLQGGNSGKDSLKNSSNKGKKKKNSKTTQVEETVQIIDNDAPPVEEASAPVEETAKTETAKTETAKTETPAIEETETPVEENEEWTEESMEKLGEQIDRVNQYAEAWGDYFYNECIHAFFQLDENVEVTGDNLYADYIRPTNIEAFIDYLESIPTEE